VANNVREKDIVFVKADLLEKFFTTEHPKIPHPYILISHNSDKNIDSYFFKYIDTKILHWFAQNNITQHPKITPIPLGIENAHFCDHGDVSYFNHDMHDKKYIVLFGFNIYTNPRARIPARDALRKNHTAEEIKNRISTLKYFKRLSRFAFVASPEGNGFDCIRTWEAMYHNTIPIVLESYHSTFFKNIGLPIMTIPTWDSLNLMTRDDYKLKYDSMIGSFTCRALWMDYWINEIYDKQK